MKCPECGARFDSKFCPECGMPADGNMTSVFRTICKSRWWKKKKRIVEFIFIGSLILFYVLGAITSPF
jgi:predicted amidophosphoribosyltransferase